MATKVLLPCEFCKQTIDSEYLSIHQCQIDRVLLTSTHKKNCDVPNKFNDCNNVVKIPCEFCDSPVYFKELMCHQIGCKTTCFKTVQNNFHSNTANHNTRTSISLSTELNLCFKSILRSRNVLSNVNKMSYVDEFFKELSKTLKTKNDNSNCTSWDLIFNKLQMVNCIPASVSKKPELLTYDHSHQNALSLKESKFSPAKYNRYANSICTRFYHDTMTHFINPIKEDPQNLYSVAKNVSFCEHHYLFILWILNYNFNFHLFITYLIIF